MIKIKQTSRFRKIHKKLKPNQRGFVDSAIGVIVQNPEVGTRKKGDLSDIYVYKFPMLGQQTLLAYIYIEDELTVLLLSLGSHENFYRDMRRN
ncbi:MAG: type II toxin-antitoxin system RelE/ParE family toxin [Rickettsiales bacterium]